MSDCEKHFSRNGFAWYRARHPDDLGCLQPECTSHACEWAAALAEWDEDRSALASLRADERKRREPVAERKQRDGVSDGLSLPCSVCHQQTQIDYHATDESWENITQVHEHGDKLGVICLECFIDLLLQYGLEPSACIERVDIIGKTDTRVFLPEATPDPRIVHGEDTSDWRGPMVCITCGYIYTYADARDRSFVCTLKHKAGDLCALRPYERRKPTPDPRDALLSQAREAMRDARDYLLPGSLPSVDSAIASIDKFKEATHGKAEI